jgi:hypothetical protein
MPTRSAFGLRLRREDGIVVPVTVLVLALTLVLVGVAAMGAGFSNKSSNGDRLAKRAQQAADAGLAAALDRMNRLDVTHGASGSAAIQCVGVAASGTLTLSPTTSGTWCPAVTENLGNGESYSYRVRPVEQPSGETTVTYSVVSAGTAGGVTRRAMLDPSALTGQPLVGHYTMVSVLDILMQNSATIDGDTRSIDGNIILSGSSNIGGVPPACTGTATPGPGKAITTSNPATVCDPEPPAETYSLAEVDPGDTATNNKNANICTLDPCSGGGVTLDSKYRLTINGSSLTLSNSGTYFFCNLDMVGNSQLTIAPGAKVKIYVGSPEWCQANKGPQPTNVNNYGMSFSNRSIITNLNIDPKTGNPDPTYLQLYVVGSPTQCSSYPLPSPSKCAVTLGNNNTTYLMLYAPHSVVQLQNNINLFGAVVGRQIVMTNQSHITYVDSVQTVTSKDLYPVFKLQGYRECTPTLPTGSTLPDAGC